jgi:outer membrane cobalamin receptor
MRRVLLPLLFLSTLLTAESRWTIRVVDPDGRPISGARVVVHTYTKEIHYPGPDYLTDFTDSNGEVHVPAGSDVQHAEIYAVGFKAAEPLCDTCSQPQEITTYRLKLAPKSDEVQVTATGTEITGTDSGTVPFALDLNAIEAMQPTAVSEAIRFLPGAVVNNQGRRGGLASLFVRGGESRYNKFIVDGVTVNDVGGTFDFGVVPTQEFERIEFVRGAESALYGTDAMTSTLQTFSQTGSTRVPELRFGADGGTFGTAHGYAALSGVIRKFDYNVFGDQSNSEGQGVNDEYSNSSQGANLGYSFSSRLAARLRVRHSNNRSGIQSFWGYQGQLPLPQDIDQFARQNNFLASAEITATHGRFQHRFSGQEYHHVRLNNDSVADRGCSFPIFDCGFNDNFNMNRAAFEYRGEWDGVLLPVLGARAVYGYRFEDENGFVNQDFSGFIINSHGLRRNHELFGEAIFNTERASVILGGRFVHNESFGDKGLPRVAASYRLLGEHGSLTGTTLRFAYGRGFKEPRLEESFGAVGAFGLVTLPNPKLGPEENRSIETGFTQGLFHQRVSLSATYFNNKFSKLIIFNTDPVTFVSQYINIGNALAHGAEFELHSRITDRVSLDSSYTYTSTQVLESDASNPVFNPGAPLLRRPKHAGQLLLNYVGKKWGGNLGGSFIGRRPDSDFFVLPIPITSVAGYARFDLGGWYAVNKRVTAYANIENLLNQRYQEVAGYPALKANFRAGLRFRIGGE